MSKRPRMSRGFALALLAAVCIAVPVASAASADRPHPDPNVAGLQTALKLKGFYRGRIDGLRGPLTTAALRAFRQKHRLPSSTLIDRRTRSALGPLGRHRFGTRMLRRGKVGLDVAALQFELRYHGFPAVATGVFGEPDDVRSRALPALCRDRGRWNRRPNDPRCTRKAPAGRTEAAATASSEPARETGRQCGRDHMPLCGRGRRQHRRQSRLCREPVSRVRLHRRDSRPTRPPGALRAPRADRRASRRPTGRRSRDRPCRLDRKDAPGDKPAR